MTRAERERLIEQYLRGEMSPEQEQDLFIQVAGDKELRTELRTYRIIENAIRKDSAVEPAGYSALRGHMQDVLAARAAAAAAPAAAAPAAQQVEPERDHTRRARPRHAMSAPVASGVRRTLRRFALVPVKMLVVVATAAAYTIGVLIVMPEMERANTVEVVPAGPGAADIPRVLHQTPATALMPVSVAGVSAAFMIAGQASKQAESGAATEAVASVPADAAPAPTRSEDRAENRERRRNGDGGTEPVKPATAEKKGADTTSSKRRMNAAEADDSPRIPLILGSPRREN